MSKLTPRRARGARRDRTGRASALALALLLALASGGCGEDDPAPAPPAETGPDCSQATLSGTKWTPSVSGAGSGNRDGSVEVATQTFESTDKLTGLNNAATSAREHSFTFTVPHSSIGAADLGDMGSISLVAETTAMPADLEGGAYPLLVSLSDGTNDLVNLTRSGGTDCAGEGFFLCSGSSCSTNADCKIKDGGTDYSAYVDRDDWEQHQIGSFAYLSTNTFPTCNWATGTPGCGFVDGSFFVSSKLRAGTYTAKYILLADSYSALGTAFEATMKLTVVQKKDPTAASGAIDLNVVIVGTDNINASRTQKGKANLNALLTHVSSHYDQTGTGIKLGVIKAVEWKCEDGGDEFAEVTLSELSDLFFEGSQLVSATTEGRAVNVFLVGDILTSDESQTILGVAGGVGGPAVNATGKSGVVFSTFGDLATFNPDCSGSSCAAADQEADFVDMGSTISHEVGHYLGLNHPTESDGNDHDRIPDTPECVTEADAVPPISSDDTVTFDSCLVSDFGGHTCDSVCAGGGYNGINVFCPAVTDCQFNHIMWYTGKHYNEGTDEGDGNLFSTESSTILNYSPFVQ